MYNLIFINNQSLVLNSNIHWCSNSTSAKWLSNLYRTSCIYFYCRGGEKRKEKLIQSFPSYIQDKASFANSIHHRLPLPQIHEQAFPLLECRVALNLYSVERQGYTKRGSTRNLSTWLCHTADASIVHQAQYPWPIQFPANPKPVSLLVGDLLTKDTSFYIPNEMYVCWFHLRPPDQALWRILWSWKFLVSSEEEKAFSETVKNTFKFTSIILTRYKLD